MRPRKQGPTPILDAGAPSIRLRLYVIIILSVTLFTTVMVHNKALSHNLKLTPIKLDRHAGSMVQSPVEKRLNDFALPQPLLDPNQRGTEPLFFLDKAMGACKAANHEHGKYPSIYEEIVQKRKQRWMEGQKDHRYNFIQMINSKLGGYMYATKLGVHTPRVIFCGMAKEIPTNMKSFGNKYVIKPLYGHSSRGVKVVKDGVDVLNLEPVSFESLTKIYHDNEKDYMVEELMESANPKYDGLTPPDYKFFVYEEGVAEMVWHIDRQHKCGDFFHIRSEKWRFLKDLPSTYPHCSQETRDALELEDSSRHEALKDAVQILASNAGPNWIRIDMFDSKHYGPVLGEFTPFSTNGYGPPLTKCVMSYLFIAHAEHGATNDDSDLLHVLTNDVIKFKDMLRMKNKTKAARLNSTFDFYPPQAREWLQFDEMTKCKKVMEAQREFD